MLSSIVSSSLAAEAAANRVTHGTDGMRRPRLAIAVGLGWGVRNYLLSETFVELRRHFDLVILSRYGEIEDFRDHFESLGVPVRGKDADDGKEFRFLEMLTVFAFFQNVRTASRNSKLLMRTKARTKIAKKRKSGRLSLLKRARMHLGAAGMNILSRLARRLYPALRRTLCGLMQTRWPHTVAMRRLLRDVEADAVFSTNYIDRWEWGAALAAKAEGLPVVTAITSWDNPTTKRFPICDYDGYLAWSPLMRDELTTYADVPDASRIRIVGAPQFDAYFNPQYQETREEFCRKHGLDPARKIIVYTTVTPGIMPDNPAVVAQVFELMQNGLPGNPQLLVRLHPKDVIERYEALRNDPKYAEIRWTLAGEPKLKKKDQWCPDRDDVVRGVNTVRHGDLNVHAGYSTMMLDFAALDKPVVLLAFNSEGCNKQSRIWESYEHLKPVVASGAFGIADNLAEAKTYIEEALLHPEARAQRRRELVELELGAIDGRSGRRAAAAVRDLLAAAGVDAAGHSNRETHAA